MFIEGRFKQCTKCKQLKPATFGYFYRLSKARDGFNYYCKNCQSDIHKKYEKYIKENKEKLPEKYAKLSGDKQKRYMKKHPEVRRKQNRKRRTIQINLPFDFTKEDEQHALEYWNYRCAICNKELIMKDGRKSWAMDHWIPLSSSDCPGTIPTNMLPMCHGKGSCNNSKHKCSPIKWLKKNYSENETQNILSRIEEYFETVKNK